MDFQNADSTSPTFIYEGFKWPQHYAVYGEGNLHELGEDNSDALVYIGPRAEIEKFITTIDEQLQNYDAMPEELIVIGLWDNHIEKTKNDYVMLATLVSRGMDNNPLEYLIVPSTIHQLTDSSSSDSDAWRAWGNLSQDYMSHKISAQETQKVASVLLHNVSGQLLNNFRAYAEDEFLRSLVPSTRVQTP